MGQSLPGQQVLCEGVIWQAKEDTTNACGYKFEGAKPSLQQQLYQTTHYHINPELYKMREYSSMRRVQYVPRQLPNPQNDIQEKQRGFSARSNQKDQRFKKQSRGSDYSSESTKHRQSQNLQSLEMTKRKSAYESLHELADDDSSLHVSASPDDAASNIVTRKPSQNEHQKHQQANKLPTFPTATSIQAHDVSSRGQPLQQPPRSTNVWEIPKVDQLVASRGNLNPSGSLRSLNEPVSHQAMPVIQQPAYSQHSPTKQMRQSRQSVMQAEYIYDARQIPPQPSQIQQIQPQQIPMQQPPSNFIRDSRQVYPMPQQYVQYPPPAQLQAHPSRQSIPNPAQQNLPVQQAYSSSLQQYPPPPLQAHQQASHPVYPPPQYAAPPAHSQPHNQHPQYYQKMLYNERMQQSHPKPQAQSMQPPGLPLAQRYSIQDTPQELAAKRNHLMEERFREVAHYYSEHNIDFAFHRSQQMVKQFDQEFKNHPAYAQRMRFIDLITSEYKDIITYWSEFNKPGWHLKSTDHGVKVSTCYQDGNVAVLVESELKVPIQVLIAVVTQINLYPKFTPFMVYSKQQKRISRNSRIGHSINEFPILSARQAFFQGIGYNRLDTNNTLFLYTRSIHNRPDLLELYDYQPNPKKDSVLLDYRYLCMQYTPTSRGMGFLRMCINVNMKVRFVPMFILERASKKFGQEFFENIYKISRSFQGSEWEQAVKQDPELYFYFKRVMEDFYTKHAM